MALFEPTNLRKENTTNDAQTVGINRYLKTDSVRRGFLKNEQSRRTGTPVLKLEPAGDIFQTRRTDFLSPVKNTQSQTLNTPSQYGINTYRENEGLFNQNRTRLQKAAYLNSESSPGLLAERELFQNNAVTTQTSGLNTVIPLSIHVNRAIQEYKNLTAQVNNTQNTIRSEADTYLRTRQSVPFGAQLLGTAPVQNQPEVAPPPTMSLIRSRGIQQYTIMNSPINENGNINRNAADLYLRSSPTQRLTTQLLP